VVTPKTTVMTPCGRFL